MEYRTGSKEWNALWIALQSQVQVETCQEQIEKRSNWDRTEGLG